MKDSSHRVAGAANARDVIDMQVIEDLRELGGSEDPRLVQELIDLFLEDAPRRFDELARGSRAGDFELLERAAHTLKSSSANVGARGLSELCRKIEACARHRSTQGLEDLVRSSSELLTRVQDVLRKLAGDASSDGADR